MDPVLTIIATCFAAGGVGAVFVSAPFALRLWIAPLLLGAAAWAAQPATLPGPWDGLAEILFATFAAAWTAPYFLRGCVEAARAINRRTATQSLSAEAPVLSWSSRQWLRRVDIALAVAALAIPTAGHLFAI